MIGPVTQLVDVGSVCQPGQEKKRGRTEPCREAPVPRSARPRVDAHSPTGVVLDVLFDSNIASTSHRGLPERNGREKTGAGSGTEERQLSDSDRLIWLVDLQFARHIPTA